MGELAAREDDGDVNCCAVELGFMHVGNGRFCWGGGVEKDVGGATICHNYKKHD